MTNKIHKNVQVTFHPKIISKNNIYNVIIYTHTQSVYKLISHYCVSGHSNYFEIIFTKLLFHYNKIIY